MPQNDLLVAAARDAARRNGLDPDLFIRMIQVESNFNPNAVSSAGAIGLGQLMPETAKEMGVTDPKDPLQNLDGSARYLKKMFRMFNDDPVLAMAAYNAGPGNVQKYNGVPPFEETQQHVAKLFGEGEVAMQTSPEALEDMGDAPIRPRSPLGPSQPVGSLTAARAEFDRLFQTPPQEQGDIDDLVGGPDGITPEMIAEHLGIAIPETPDHKQAFSDAISELIVDQLDPLNLALLVGSFGAGSLAFKATAKLLGAPIIQGAAAATASNVFTKTGKAVIGKHSFIPRLAEGAAINLGFSAAELFEEPEEPGTSRLGEFGKALAFNQVFDVILLSVGVPVSYIGRMRREVFRTFKMSLDAAGPGGFGRAAADAMVSRVEMLRAAGVPDDTIQAVLDASQAAVSETTIQLVERLFVNNRDQLFLQAQKMGLRGPKGEALTPEVFEKGMMDMFDDLLKTNLEDQIQKEAAKMAELNIELGQLGEKTLRKFNRDTVENRAARLEVGFGEFKGTIPQAIPELLERPDLLDAVAKNLEIIETAPGGVGGQIVPFPSPEVVSAGGADVNAAIERLAALGFGRRNLRELRRSSLAAIRRGQVPRQPTSAAQAVARGAAEAEAEQQATSVRSLQQSLRDTFPTSGEIDDIDAHSETIRRYFDEMASSEAIISSARKGTKPEFAGQMEGIRVLRDLLSKGDFAPIELQMVVEGARSVGVPVKRIRKILREFGRSMPERPPISPGEKQLVRELEIRGASTNTIRRARKIIREQEAAREGPPLSIVELEALLKSGGPGAARFPASAGLAFAGSIEEDDSGNLTLNMKKLAALLPAALGGAMAVPKAAKLLKERADIFGKVLKRLGKFFGEQVIGGEETFPVSTFSKAKGLGNERAYNAAMEAAKVPEELRPRMRAILSDVEGGPRAQMEAFLEQELRVIKGDVPVTTGLEKPSNVVVTGGPPPKRPETGTTKDIDFFGEGVSSAKRLQEEGSDLLDAPTPGIKKLADMMKNDIDALESDRQIKLFAKILQETADEGELGQALGIVSANNPRLRPKIEKILEELGRLDESTRRQALSNLNKGTADLTPQVKEQLAREAFLEELFRRAGRSVTTKEKVRRQDRIKNLENFSRLFFDRFGRIPTREEIADAIMASNTEPRVESALKRFIQRLRKLSLERTRIADNAPGDPREIRPYLREIRRRIRSGQLPDKDDTLMAKVRKLLDDIGEGP